MFVFEERGKPEDLGKSPSEQGREPITNSTHIWRRRRDFEPGPYWWVASALTTAATLASLIDSKREQAKYEGNWGCVPISETLKRVACVSAGPRTPLIHLCSPLYRRFRASATHARKQLNKGYLSMDFCRTRVSRVFHDKEPKQGRNSCPWLRLPGVRKPWGFFILSVFLLYGVSKWVWSCFTLIIKQKI